MKNYIIIFALLIGCTDLSMSPEPIKYDSTEINALLYAYHTPGLVDYKFARVISATHPIDTVITIQYTNEVPHRARTLFYVTMTESKFGYTAFNNLEVEHEFVYNEIEIGTIETLENPYVYFDIGLYTYGDFINDYSINGIDEPNFYRGDQVRFVATDTELNAIFEK